MASNVSDFIIQHLHDWGVNRIYGYPGAGIDGLMGALNRAQDKITLVRACHEEMCAFMACAHAKFTGEIGVCMATSGPGAIHLLTGLYDAKLDHMPVLAIVGQQARSALGGQYQQEVDLVSLFKDVACDYVEMLTLPAQVRHVIDRALRIAISKRGVTCVIVPDDLQTADAVPAPLRARGSADSGMAYHQPDVCPREEDLQTAAKLLNAGSRVAILAGAGALDASDELIEVADVLGAGVAKALLGKAALPDDLPFVTGAIGLLGTKPSWDLMAECDTLLMIGSRFPYSEFLPREGQARGVQIDIDPAMLSIRYPMEVNLTGDAATTLRALLPMLERKSDRAWRERIENNVAEWWQVIEARAMTAANPINPERLFWELSSKLPDYCVVSSDSGSAANWYARDIKIRCGMLASLSGRLATMGPGVPYAIAAKFAFPERVAFALVGDGAMQMNGNAELITIRDHWREWNDPRLIILVLNNRELNQVTSEQRALEGDPEFDTSQHVQDFPYARYAEMLGLKGVRVDKPEQIAPAWDAALEADRPCLIEAITDPEVPPLPPHITLKQAKSFAASMLKGDSDRRDVPGPSTRAALTTMFPGSGDD